MIKAMPPKYRSLGFPAWDHDNPQPGGLGCRQVIASQVLTQRYSEAA
ncbi:hypothetical protein Q31b_56310 [Novipirellula aureliae]|uniref:Uncharacterized protein n=1 Tax=Novipirellula aureliae TaxID=2527966 RepID=A0A5C6DB79_9BACT|nr:hypothetical protein Q31b_56310 [Novipirellula aureliae]